MKFTVEIEKVGKAWTVKLDGELLTAGPLAYVLVQAKDTIKAKVEAAGK